MNTYIRDAEIYEAYTYMASKAKDLANECSLSYRRVMQIIEEEHEREKRLIAGNVFETLCERYPDVLKRTISLAVNALVRYSVFYDSKKDVGKSLDNFFHYFETFDRDDLLRIRNMGIKCIEFLEMAYKDWKGNE